MAKDLPYLPTYKNLGKLFEKIGSAKAPDAFTHQFLQDTIGLKGTGDRPLIGILKKLGFLDQNGKPTPTYALLKNKTTASAAIAEGIRAAYKPLFDSNEKANTLEGENLRGLIAQVAGTDEDMTKAIAYTFAALVKLGDFSKKAPVALEQGTDTVENQNGGQNLPKFGNLRSDFHFNIQIHLPSNGGEETYLNIFNALRKAFN